MACCENMGAEGEPNGFCPDCGAETVDGFAVDVCGYQQVECETCGYAPCDESC